MMRPLGLELLASLEHQFAQSKALHIKGTARVRLSQLSFSEAIRPINAEIIRSLKRDFKARGCLQYEASYGVPAIIDNNSFQAALESLHISAESFKSDSAIEPSKFELPIAVKLNCLHGQHRIVAASEFLPAEDRWWLVDIYDEDLDARASQRFKDGHSYSSNYSDGEVFRQIRVCQFNGDTVGEAQWRACITVNKEKDLNKLLRRGQLMTALDSILPLRGVWKGFHLGSMDIFLSLRCDEEIAVYIEFIRTTWSTILEDEQLYWQHVDQETVELVERRAPGVCKQDYDFLRQEIQSKRLFPEIHNSSARASIEKRLLQTKRLIPSLYTLFKDLRYLEPAIRAIKALLPISPDQTILQCLRFLFKPQESSLNSMCVQESEVIYTTVSGSFSSLFDLAIRELFLCAIRYFSQPTDISSKKNMNPIKQTADASKRFLGFRIAEFASRLGFEVRRQDDWPEDVDQQLLSDILNNLPREIFRPKQRVSAGLLKAFKEHLSSSVIQTSDLTLPAVTTPNNGEPLSRRYGRSYIEPSEDEADQSHLFLRKMHAPLRESQIGDHGITSFYIKKCIYLAFFKPAEIPEAESSGPDRNAEEEDRDSIYSRVSNNQRNSSPAPQNSRETIDALASESQVMQVSFVALDGYLLYNVPFVRDAVESKAKEVAGQGFSLMDESGRHWVWHEIYSILLETDSRKIFIVGSIHDHTSIEEDILIVESGVHKKRGLQIIGRRPSERDLVHKAR